jgi:hypothetical protein
MRTLTVLAVLFAAPIWADRLPDPASDDVGRGGRGRPRCVSKGGSCQLNGCCPGLVCSLNMCEEKDELSDDELARKKAHAEHRDEPSPK